MAHTGFQNVPLVKPLVVGATLLGLGFYGVHEWKPTSDLIATSYAWSKGHWDINTSDEELDDSSKGSEDLSISHKEKVFADTDKAESSSSNSPDMIPLYFLSEINPAEFRQLFEQRDVCKLFMDKKENAARIFLCQGSRGLSRLGPASQQVPVESSFIIYFIRMGDDEFERFEDKVLSSEEPYGNDVCNYMFLSDGIVEMGWHRKEGCAGCDGAMPEKVEG